MSNMEAAREVNAGRYMEDLYQECTNRLAELKQELDALVSQQSTLMERRLEVEALIKVLETSTTQITELQQSKTNRAPGLSIPDTRPPAFS